MAEIWDVCPSKPDPICFKGPAPQLGFLVVRWGGLPEFSTNGCPTHTATPSAPTPHQGGFRGPRWPPDSADLGGSGLPLVPTWVQTEPCPCAFHRAPSFSTHPGLRADYVQSSRRRVGRAAWKVNLLPLGDGKSRNWKAPTVRDSAQGEGLDGQGAL